jgi:heat shock protein HtpX
MTRFFNNVKTAVLLGAMFGIVLLIGSFFGKNGLLIAFVLGGLMNFVAYFFSDSIALASMRGRQVTADTEPKLVSIVEELARNAGLPMPRVYVCPHEAPNAFATGRNPKHAAVAITEGALNLLTEAEVRGVIAHELAHVKNRDTLTSCIAATIAGAISHLGYALMWFGSDRDRGGNPLALLALVILAPIAAAIIQMAISRSREFVADSDGAHIAGTAHGLMSALAKLDAHARGIPLEGEHATQSHMFIVKPFSGESFATLFSTHPSTAARIEKLRELGI